MSVQRILSVGLDSDQDVVLVRQRARQISALLGFSQQATYLTTYNDNLSLLIAAAKLLYGQIQPSGTLPVALPPLFPIGFGLAEY